MTLLNAREILRVQDKNLRKVNGLRFEKDGYEYKVVWEGGFSSFVSLWRREIGKRNFKYFKGFGAYKCWSVWQVLDLIEECVGGAVHAE